jgi:hypothetical protein
MIARQSIHPHAHVAAFVKVWNFITMTAHAAAWLQKLRHSLYVHFPYISIASLNFLLLNFPAISLSQHHYLLRCHALKHLCTALLSYHILFATSEAIFVASSASHHLICYLIIFKYSFYLINDTLKRDTPHLYYFHPFSALSASLQMYCSSLTLSIYCLKSLNSPVHFDALS